MQLYGSPDGGKTIYPVKTDAGGNQFTSTTNVSACKVAHGVTVSEDVTCTVAGRDYGALMTIPAGTKYVTVYCASACKWAMGEVTSSVATATCFDPAIFDPLIFQNATASGVGRWIAAGSAPSCPVSAADIAAGYRPHVQSPTGGAVVTFTYQAD